MKAILTITKEVELSEHWPFTHAEQGDVIGEALTDIVMALLGEEWVDENTWADGIEVLVNTTPITKAISPGDVWERVIKRWWEFAFVCTQMHRLYTVVQNLDQRLFKGVDRQMLFQALTEIQKYFKGEYDQAKWQAKHPEEPES